MLTERFKQFVAVRVDILRRCWLTVRWQLANGLTLHTKVRVARGRALLIEQVARGRLPRRLNRQIIRRHSLLRARQDARLGRVGRSIVLPTSRIPSPRHIAMLRKEALVQFQKRKLHLPKCAKH